MKKVNFCELPIHIILPSGNEKHHAFWIRDAVMMAESHLMADDDFVDGCVKLPVKPGLGVEVTKELVIEENKMPDKWKNPVWWHSDGSIA